MSDPAYTPMVGYDGSTPILHYSSGQSPVVMLSPAPYAQWTFENVGYDQCSVSYGNGFVSATSPAGGGLGSFWGEILMFYDGNPNIRFTRTSTPGYDGWNYSAWGGYPFTGPGGYLTAANPVQSGTIIYYRYRINFTLLVGAGSTHRVDMALYTP